MGLGEGEQVGREGSKVLRIWAAPVLKWLSVGLGCGQGE